MMPTAPAPRGRIVYARTSSDSIELRTILPDGSGDAPVTLPTLDNVLPAWSPDGQRLAYQGKWDAAHWVCLVDSAGNGLVRTGPPGAWRGMPAWSPDGRRLAFSVGGERAGLYVAASDGKAAERLVAASALLPFWTPDGGAIGFTRASEDGESGEIVFRRLSDGKEAMVTSTGDLALGGAVSPDGKRLAYLRARPSSPRGTLRLWDLPDGEDRTLFSLDLSYVTAPFLMPRPAWSPDGEWLLLPITTDRGRPLYRVSLDGKTREPVTPDGLRCLHASWKSEPPAGC